MIVKFVLLFVVVVLLCGAKLYYTNRKKCNAWDKLKAGDKVWCIVTNEITGISSTHITHVVDKTDDKINLEGEGWIPKKIFFRDLSNKQYVFY